jgi:hypothetical protein
MVASIVNGDGRRGGWRAIGWGAAAILLLLPYAANAPWTVFDYVFAAALLGSLGLVLELVVRKSRNLAFRFGAAVAVIAAVLTVWINGAVGMIGSEDNPYNLLFLGVPPIALMGAFIARFRPAGMSRAMAVAAAVQGAFGAVGMVADLRGGIFSLTFAGLWLLAAFLFRNAAQSAAAGAAPR